VAVSATVAGVLPLFLVAGLSIFVREDFGFGVGELGFAVSIYFVTSALASSPTGGLVERIGFRGGLMASVSTSGLILLAIGGLADRWGHLMVLLAIGGVANAMTQVSSNLLLARLVSTRRQGLSYGIKQSAIPIATLVAGASVGTVATGLGWRSVFIAAGCLAAVVVIAAARLQKPEVRGSTTASGTSLAKPEIRALVFLAVAAGLASSVANALGAFLVESSVQWMSQEQAGLALVFGSISGICARIGLGWFVDRGRVKALVLVSVQLVVAIFGYGWLAVATTPLTVTIAAVIAFASGWGWTGVLIYAVASSHPWAPASATGIAQTGVYAGAVFGPALFGALADSFSYTTAWMWGAGMVAASAVVMVAGARRMTGAIAARTADATPCDAE
jgi:MFS family permease